MIGLMIVWSVIFCTAHASKQNMPCGTLQYEDPVYMGSNVTITYTPNCPADVNSVVWKTTKDNHHPLGNGYMMTNNTASFFLTFKATSSQKDVDFYVVVHLKTGEWCKCGKETYWLRLKMGPEPTIEQNVPISKTKQTHTNVSETSKTVSYQNISTSNMNTETDAFKQRDRQAMNGETEDDIDAQTQNRKEIGQDTSKGLNISTNYVTKSSSTPVTTSTVSVEQQTNKHVHKVIGEFDNPKHADNKNEQAQNEGRLYKLTLLLTSCGCAFCLAIIITVICIYKKVKRGQDVSESFTIERRSESESSREDPPDRADSTQMDDMYAKIHKRNMVKPQQHASAGYEHEDQSVVPSSEQKTITETNALTDMSDSGPF